MKFAAAKSNFFRRKREPAFVAMTAVLTALSVVGRVVFAPLAGFKPCTAVIIIAGISLGAESGILCGVFTALISNIYFGHGIWTLYQMISWGAVGALSGALRKPLGCSKPLLCGFAIMSGALYSLLMDLFSALWQDGGFNPLRFIALATASLPYTVSYALSNLIFLLLIGDRLLFAVDRVKRRCGTEMP